MSNLYGTSQITSIEEMANSKELLELFAIDDILSESAEDIKAFCESEEGKVMLEKAGLDKKFIDRATVRKMDLNRRIKLTSYMLAKGANDPNWAKLAKYSKLKKQYAEKILTKYGKKAERIAKVSQKEFIKKAKSTKAE